MPSGATISLSSAPSANLAPGQTDFRVEPGSWSIDDVLHHLALAEEASAKLMAFFQKRAGEESLGPDPSPDGSALGTIEALVEGADDEKAPAPESRDASIEAGGSAGPRAARSGTSAHPRERRSALGRRRQQAHLSASLLRRARICTSGSSSAAGTSAATRGKSSASRRAPDSRAPEVTIIRSALFFLLLPLAPASEEVEVSLLPAEGEAARYWPRWRGPSGQGLVEGIGLSRRVVRHEERALAHRRSGKRGTPSPIVFGDRVFLTTARETGRKLSLLSYRRSDLKLLWEPAIPTEGVEHVHEKNGHASATPVTDGERVFASFGSQGLAAFDFDGKILWHRKLGDLSNYHGSAGSPILYRGQRHPLSGPEERVLRLRARSKDRRDALADGTGARRSAGELRWSCAPLDVTSSWSRASTRSTPTTRERKAALDRPGEQVRGHPDSGRRTRSRFLLFRPIRPDPRNPSRGARET